MASLKNFYSAPLLRATSITDSNFDAVVIVSSCLKALESHASLAPVVRSVQDFAELHKSAISTSNLITVDKSVVPSGRIIFSGTGPVTRDFDDVRRFSQAATRAMRTALSAGVRSPLFVTVPHPKFPTAELVSALGALHPSYTPLNVRLEDNKQKFTHIGLLPVTGEDSFSHIVDALEQAFTVTRDVGEGDPQRMAPPKVADYIKHAFAGSNIKVEVTDDQDVILKEYPLMAAVNRAANQVKEHQARLIRLEYVPEGPITETKFLVGKGVTIDTGGCDLKTGGHMYGMCRDKYGSAVVAGFFKTLQVLKPKGIKVVGYMCMVRNSIGEHCYTCDEIITSRAGKRIHIVNTDAEGRVTMLDPLTRAKEEALHEVNPHMFTVATLTGHEFLTYGYYASMMDNGPAKVSGQTQQIQKAGDEFGQPIEITRLHFDDYDFHDCEGEHADVRQGNTKPSVQTCRGHMSPAAFLMKASGLDAHGLDSDKPIKFTHIDMGSACGDYPTTTNPNPLVALVSGMILPKI